MSRPCRTCTRFILCRASSRRKALTDTRMIGLDGALKGNQDSSFKLIVRPRMIGVALFSGDVQSF
ncbi:unnamed protein product [Cyprideis torosa]|uniref:Uncharacterized protein n=1 Tax=Cyprideis torosa TaxID=163714 RepID=A0A7R8WI03_9CRUS|nr:unnamed protein product [Cyprideis torosa]CAG0897255.1 unnamed protein product [Cyprideis torosa]